MDAMIRVCFRDVRRPDSIKAGRKRFHDGWNGSEDNVLYIEDINVFALNAVAMIAATKKDFSERCDLPLCPFMRMPLFSA